MKESVHNDTFGSTLLYYQLFHPSLQLYIEQPTNDLGVYEDEVFASLINGDVEKKKGVNCTYLAAPKIKTVVFLDALYQASKGMEPFLTISTRLFKLMVDDHQGKAAEIDLDLELYDKIKTIYWGILQEDASEGLINQGFEIVVQDAVEICTKKLLEDISGE